MSLPTHEPEWTLEWTYPGLKTKVSVESQKAQIPQVTSDGQHPETSFEAFSRDFVSSGHLALNLMAIGQGHNQFNAKSLSCNKQKHSYIFFHYHLNYLQEIIFLFAIISELLF